MNAYGISKEDLEALMMICQCDVCGREISWIHNHKTKAYIDHCHCTNEVRGVLCIHCNTSIGKLGDDVKSIQHVLNYLKNPPGLCRE